MFITVCKNSGCYNMSICTKKRKKLLFTWIYLQSIQGNICNLTREFKGFGTKQSF